MKAMMFHFDLTTGERKVAIPNVRRDSGWPIVARTPISPATGTPELVDTIPGRVIAVIQAHFCIPDYELVDTKSFTEQLGLDSLDLMSTMADLEADFGVEFPYDAAARFATVSDVVSYLLRSHAGHDKTSSTPLCAATNRMVGG